MSYSFDEFCADCHDALAADAGPAGREKVVGLLENLLVDEDFVRERLGPEQTSGRQTVYEDPDTGICVLLHRYDHDGGGTPHDHGASWAVYGQVREHSDIKVFERLDGGTGEGDADLEVRQEFSMTPGKAALFDVGVIHSINFVPGGRVVRVTGCDLDRIPKLRFDQKNGKALRWLGGPSGS
jgi:hypothetical protein